MITWIYIVFFMVILFILWWQFFFLRDPKRKISKNPNLIVSPADGKVTLIMKYKGNEAIVNKKNGKVKTLTKDIGKSVYIVSIFMSVFNVHINRAPITGSVIWQKHTSGKFKPAFNFFETLYNENNQIIIKGKIKIKVIQIAGLLARRIVSFVRVNQNIKKGSRIGLINLGSQVTIIMPSSVKLSIKEGQMVKAGESIIGRVK